MLDDAGDELFHTMLGGDEPEGIVSYRLCAYLSGMTPWRANLPLSERLFGLEIQDRLQLVGMDACYYTSRDPATLRVDPRVWYNDPFTPAYWVDPYHRMVPSDMRKNDIDYSSLCAFLDHTVPASLDALARDAAEVARLLALHSHMI